MVRAEGPILERDEAERVIATVPSMTREDVDMASRRMLNRLYWAAVELTARAGEEPPGNAGPAFMARRAYRLALSHDFSDRHLQSSLVRAENAVGAKRNHRARLADSALWDARHRVDEIRRECE